MYAALLLEISGPLPLKLAALASGIPQNLWSNKLLEDWCEVCEVEDDFLQKHQPDQMQSTLMLLAQRRVHRQARSCYGEELIRTAALSLRSLASHVLTRHAPK